MNGWSVANHLIDVVFSWPVFLIIGVIVFCWCLMLFAMLLKAMD